MTVIGLNDSGLLLAPFGMSAPNPSAITCGHVASDVSTASVIIDQSCHTQKGQYLTSIVNHPQKPLAARFFRLREASRSLVGSILPRWHLLVNCIMAGRKRLTKSSSLGSSLVSLGSIAHRIFDHWLLTSVAMSSGEVAHVPSSFSIELIGP